MVDFLVPCKRFIELLFNRRNSPVDSPSAFIFLIVLNRALYVTEPVIFQGEPDNFDVVLVQVEVVASVRRLVWSDGHRILVGPENQEFSLYLSS